MSRDDSTTDADVLNTNAYIAVGLLTDAVDPDTYHERDVDEAKGHLRTALDDVATGTPGAERTASALAALDGLDEATHDDRRRKVSDALAELAPVAAGVAGGRDREARPTVPVFYHVPSAAVDRALSHFKRRRANNPTPERRTDLKEYIYSEIDEQPVVYVDGEPLGEYASGRVESTVIEPDSERDTDQ